MFIVDAHLDLSMNALEWNRDLRSSIQEINDREKNLTDKPDRGLATVSLEELRKGNIGLVVATQIARYVDRNSSLPVMTLLPGDVISTGTPHGVGLGFKPPIYLQPGDIVTLGMDGLGEQKQTAVAYAS